MTRRMRCLISAGLLVACFSGFVAAAAAQDSADKKLVLRDVTSLRRLEVMRRDFVTNVSHELRTPLTAVRGYLEALRDAPDLPAGQRRQFLVRPRAEPLCGGARGGVSRPVGVGGAVAQVLPALGGGGAADGGG